MRFIAVLDVVQKYIFFNCGLNLFSVWFETVLDVAREGEGIPVGRENLFLFLKRFFGTRRGQ